MKLKTCKSGTQLLTWLQQRFDAAVREYAADSPQATPQERHQAAELALATLMMELRLAKRLGPQVADVNHGEGTVRVVIDLTNMIVTQDPDTTDPFLHIPAMPYSPDMEGLPP